MLGYILQIQTGVEANGFCALNSCPFFHSSGTEKIINLSVCEAELHSIVSSALDGIYIRAALELALGTKVDHYIYTDSSSARQLAMKRGLGNARHLDGKLSWIQQIKGKISGWYKYQQIATWQTSIQSRLEDKKSDT